MQPFHTIDVYEMCGEVVLSQGVILSAHCAQWRDMVVLVVPEMWYWHDGCGGGNCTLCVVWWLCIRGVVVVIMLWVW